MEVLAVIGNRYKNTEFPTMVYSNFKIINLNSQSKVLCQCMNGILSAQDNTLEKIHTILT